MLTDENSPAFIIGGFQSALAATKVEPKLAKAFRTGEGIGWDEHDEGGSLLVRSVFSGPDMPPTWSVHGSLHWMGLKPS